MGDNLAVLGRQPEISVAELKSLFFDVEQITENLATFNSSKKPDIARLGGTLKLAKKLTVPPIDFLNNLPSGKITLGISDFSSGANVKTAINTALGLKKQLKKSGRSVRVVPNKAATLSSATSFHNGLGGKPNKVELLLVDKAWFYSIGVQDIESYSKRDQARPVRDAKIGMLPPKLAQILINLCGDLPAHATILDPFCGSGVVLQEAAMMGYAIQGTDKNIKMVNASTKNLAWLEKRLGRTILAEGTVTLGDATDHLWTQPIGAVAAEIYLGPPMSTPPAEIKLKAVKQECGSILLGFLKNLAPQIEPNTPVVLATPAWLRPDGNYQGLNLLDEIEKLGYNVRSDSGFSDLLYHRSGQVVARKIIVLRKR